MGLCCGAWGGHTPAEAHAEPGGEGRGELRQLAAEGDDAHRPGPLDPRGEPVPLQLRLFVWVRVGVVG